MPSNAGVLCPAPAKMLKIELPYSCRPRVSPQGRLRKLADSGKRDPSIDGCPAAHTFDQQSIAGDSRIAEETHSRIFPVPIPTRSAARRN